MGERGSGKEALEEERQEDSLLITREEVEKKAPPSRPEFAIERGSKGEIEKASAVKPAGFWVRLVAKILDLLVVMVPFGILVGAVMAADGMGWPAIPWDVVQDASFELISVLCALYLVTYAVYSIASHAADGKTVGKCICGIRTLPSGEMHDRELYYFARFLVALLGLAPLGVGHIIAGFRRDKRTLHDLVTGSQVVHNQS